MDSDSGAPFTTEEIARRARLIWERAGRPEGRHLDHWFQAERELRQQREQSDQTQALIARAGSAGKPRR